MSVKALNWAFDLVLPEHGLEMSSRLAVKAVLVALANHANEGRETWVSLPTISRYTGADERTVRRALACIVALGLAERRPRPGKSDVYILKMGDENDAHPSLNGPPSKSTPHHMAPLHGGTKPPSMVAPTPLHDGGANLLNPIKPHDARARDGQPYSSPPARMPDTAKWAERLASYRPWEGKSKWPGFWGVQPDSAGINPHIPKPLLAAWRAEYDKHLALDRARREARQDGAMASSSAGTDGHSL